VEYSAFGLTIRSDFELPWPAGGMADDARPLQIELVDLEELKHAWSGTTDGPTWDTVFPGDRRVTVERGRAGDQLFRYAERDYFLISARGDMILCAPRDREDMSWLRFLLDTVLWWTALANGLHVLHAGAVELDGGVVAIISDSGGGKSTLTAELLLRGAPLFSDDLLVLGPANELLAHPGPPLMNLAADRGDLRELGTPLARLDEGAEEAWVRIDRATDGPRPLRALFLYRRGPDLQLAVERLRPTVVELAPHAWAIPDDVAAARKRFELLGLIAENVPVFALTAHLSDSPATIADELATALR
jgi:hypothetical protein